MRSYESRDNFLALKKILTFRLNNLIIILHKLEQQSTRIFGQVTAQKN